MTSVLATIKRPPLTVTGMGPHGAARPTTGHESSQRYGPAHRHPGQVRTASTEVSIRMLCREVSTGSRTGSEVGSSTVPVLTPGITSRYRGWHESTLLSRQPRRDHECRRLCTRVVVNWAVTSAWLGGAKGLG